ncbi:MAG: hypothetical protein RI949_2809 [Pseudomonadota bacterium]|jgi:uncharacterized protein
MNIAWDLFTPGRSLLGGLLIGVATALYLWGTGRIAGIATLLAAPMKALWERSSLGAQRQRVLFLVGLLVAPWAWKHVAPMPPSSVDVSWPVLVLAGLLVGVGSRMGNGCTSGHGICGLSRLSLRSLVNVLTFMVSGVITVFVLRHVI